jgi:hypothetical protein
MKRLFRGRLLWLVLLAGMVGLAVAGCSTTGENDNRSERPWNQPRSWETGLPSSLYDRR